MSEGQERITVRCQHCVSVFEVGPELVGGITNCPDCGRATQVGGLRDPLWRGLQLGWLLLALGVGVLLSLAHGVGLGSSVGVGLLLLGWLLRYAL